MQRVVFDADEYGWGSREWLVIQAIEHAPQENKDLALRSLIKILVNTEQTTTTTLLDILSQLVLTGAYIPTVRVPEIRVSEPAPEADDLYPENDNPANSLKPFTEEEIAGFMRRMDQVLSDPETGESAKDPFEDWTLDDDNS